MKKLDELTINIARKMEKESNIFEKKKIWVRAWLIMLERHEDKRKFEDKMGWNK